jgi:hypothetical protein
MTGSSILKGVVVGVATAVPTILLLLFEIVNPAGVGFRSAPVPLILAILVFAALAGALTGRLADGARRRRWLKLFGVELASYAVGLTGYTALVVLQGTSAPSSVVSVIILWLLVGMVTTPVVVPFLALGAWLLERWTRRST